MAKYRVREIDKNYYVIERRKFLFFWELVELESNEKGFHTQFDTYGEAEFFCNHLEEQL